MSDQLPEHGGFKLGHIPYRGKPRFAVPVLAPMPKSEWIEFDVTATTVGLNTPMRVEDQGEFGAPALPPPAWVENQGQFGACNGFAAAKSAEWGRWMAGMTHVRLSPWFVYAILCNGVDRGSNIGDALDLLSKTGTCRFESVPEGTINPNRLSTAARAEAVNYRIEMGEILPDFDAIMTAVQLRRSGNFSIRAGPNFDSSSLDAIGSDGVVGYSRGAGNHAVAFVPAAKKLADGEWAVKFQNSWGPTWGNKGFAWFTRRHFDDQSYREAYSVVASIDTPGDATNPPPVSPAG